MTFFCSKLPSDEFVFVADFFDLIGPMDDKNLRKPFADSDDLTIEFAEPDMTSSLIESTTETIGPEDDNDLLTVSQLVVADDDASDDDDDLLTVSQLCAPENSSKEMTASTCNFEEDLLTVSQLDAACWNAEEDLLTVSQLGATGSNTEEDLTVSTVSIAENDDDDFLLVSSMLPFSVSETTASWKKKKNKKKQKLMYDSFNDFEFYK